MFVANSSQSLFTRQKLVFEANPSVKKIKIKIMTFK